MEKALNLPSGGWYKLLRALTGKNRYEVIPPESGVREVIS
jgi:hypothetical protein